MSVKPPITTARWPRICRTLWKERQGDFTFLIEVWPPARPGRTYRIAVGRPQQEPPLPQSPLIWRSQHGAQ